SISPSRDRPRRRRASRALRTRWIPLNETAAWNYYVTHLANGIVIAVGNIVIPCCRFVQRDRASRALRTRWIPLNETAAWNYYVTHRYDDAIRQVRSLLELQPNYGWAYSIMAMSYSGLARHEEAINAAERGRQLLDTPMVQIAQAVVYANAGRRQAAQRLLAQLTDRKSTRLN